MFELLGMETEVDDLRNANKEDIQERRKKFSNLLGAVEGDEDEDDDDSCSLSECGSESSLGQFSIRGSADFTGMGLGLNDDLLAELLGVKEKDVVEQPPPGPVFHGRGGKVGAEEVDAVSDEMKLIAARKQEEEERRRHMRGMKEYNAYLKSYEQKMIAVATLPDASVSVSEHHQHQHQHQHQLNQSKGLDDSLVSTDSGEVIIGGSNRSNVSFLRPQVMVQSGWGGSLLQAYVTRHQTSSTPTSSHGGATAATNVTTTAPTNTTTTASATGADGGGGRGRLRAGEEDSASAPLSTLAASKGALMPPLSELFYRNPHDDQDHGQGRNQVHGHGQGQGQGQPSLQPQPPGTGGGGGGGAKEGGRIVSVAVARRKYAEASKSVVAERQRLQSDAREVVVLTPDGHDHSDKGVGAGTGTGAGTGGGGRAGGHGHGHGSRSHHPPSHLHRRRVHGEIVEGEEIPSSTSGAQGRAQRGALASDVESSDAGFAFAYVANHWRAKDATSGVLQQVYIHTISFQHTYSMGIS